MDSNRTYLGQVGRLSDAIDTAERHDVRSLRVTRGHCVTQDVDATVRTKQRHTGVLQRRLDRVRYG